MPLAARAERVVGQGGQQSIPVRNCNVRMELLFAGRVTPEVPKVASLSGRKGLVELNLKRDIKVLPRTN